MFLPGRPHGAGRTWGSRLYRALAAVVGAAAGGGVRPGRDRPGGAGGEGAGEEPAAGRGQARRLRHRPGPGRGAGSAAAPVGGRAVHPVRAGAVARGAADAAHEPAVHRPPGGAAAVSGGYAAAAGTGQGALQPGGNRRVSRPGGRAAHSGPADAGGGAGLPGRRRRADPRRPARRARQRRVLPLRRGDRGRPRRPAAGGAGAGPLPRPAARRGGVRRVRPDHRGQRPGTQEHRHPADPVAVRRGRAAPAGHQPAAGDLAGRGRGAARPATAFMHAAGITCSQRLGDLLAALDPADEATAVALPGATR